MKDYMPDLLSRLVYVAVFAAVIALVVMKFAAVVGKVAVLP